MKRTLITICFTFAICALLFGAALTFVGADIAAAESELNAEVTGVQVRSGGGNYNFIVLQNSIYHSVAADTEVASPSQYNTSSKVRIYTSATDTEGVLLSTVCNAGWWTQNLWGSGGLMIELLDENYAVYNGTTIYKIVIEAGCQLPCGTADNMTVYETTKEVVFINLDYGDESDSVKNGAINWLKPPQYEEGEITGVQVRSNGDNNGYDFIVLQNSVYESLALDTTVKSTTSYNTKSKVKIYMSASDTEGIYLTEICGDWWTQNLWTSGGLMLQIKDYSTYNGSTIYKIEIEAGCELPCVTADSHVIYSTTKKVIFINNGYGLESEEAKNFAVSWRMEIEPTISQYEDGEVEGIQVRSTGDNTGYDFIVLQNTAYANVDADTSIGSVNWFNTKSKIKIYMSEEDAEGKYLTEICGDWWTQNMWGSGGLMLQVGDYSAYNGSTIYKIEIEEGCQLPCGTSDSLTVYTTTQKAIFVNSNYGQENPNWAVTWRDRSKPIFDFGTSDFTKCQNRAATIYENDARWLLLSCECEFQTTEDAASWVEELNLLDSIYFYLSDDLTKEPVVLRDIYAGSVDLRTYGEATTLGIHIKNLPAYDGPHMYMVEIKPGCQFPYAENGNIGYLTVEKGKTFINTEYGISGDIFGMYDEDGNATTYEVWSVNWSSVRKVTFTVEGLDGVSYNPITVTVGDFIAQKDYEVEGYDLVITDADGNIGMQGYYVPDNDLNLILKYTKSQPQTPQTDNAAVIWICVGAVALVAAAAIAVVLVKKGGKSREK